MIKGSRAVKRGVIIRIKEKIESTARYEYRNTTKEYKFKCTICGHKWRRFSTVYFSEHLRVHIEKGDVAIGDIYEASLA